MDDFITFINSIPDECFYGSGNHDRQIFLNPTLPTGTRDLYPTDTIISEGLLEMRRFISNEHQYNRHARIHSGYMHPEADLGTYQKIEGCNLCVANLLPIEYEKYPNVEFIFKELDENDIEQRSLYTGWKQSRADVILAEFISDSSASIAKVFIAYNKSNEIEGYSIMTYQINTNRPTKVEVLAIDLKLRQYHYLYRYRPGILPIDRIHGLLDTPSRIAYTIKNANWSNYKPNFT